MIPVQKHMRSQAGFTLVELAIVMIIIGLLIAGVLKGQALIANARVTSTVAQTKASEAATTTFRDTYNFIPGDMTNPNVRLPNCAALPCSFNGNGDGKIAQTPANAPSNESLAFWPQLYVAGLVTGIQPGNQVFGGDMPEAKISGVGIGVGSSSIPPVAADFGANLIGATMPQNGMYLVFTNSPTAAQGAATVALTPDQALRIDTKLDDGLPDTGDVRGAGGAGMGAGNFCGNPGGAPANGYATINSYATCTLYVHFQG
jgi:prepilin-type N-terminal cleavage/methylation domain-containing protein